MQNKRFSILLLNLFILAVCGQFQTFEGTLEITAASLKPGISIPHTIIGALTTDEPSTYNLLFSSNVETRLLTSKIRVAVTGRVLGLPKPLNLTQSVRFANKPIIDVHQISVLDGQKDSRQLPSRLNVAVILVATRDKQPVLDTAGASDLITQVSSLYLESSWNTFTFNVDADGNGEPDVFGPYTVDYDPTLCEYSLWSDSAYTMAGNAGVQLDLYDNFVYILNSFSPCAAGWGVIGCEPDCNAWIFIPYADAIAHELGHNIGLNHASTDYNNDGFIDDEYGDTSCIMGYSAVPLRQFNSIHKDIAGWIPSSNILTGIEDNTTITISALSAPLSSYPVSIKIPWNGITYVVSFRSTYGFDANLQLYTPSFDNRISIHRETTNAYSLLVKILDVGESYNFGVQVTYLGYQDQLAQVELLFGIPVPIPPIPCTYRWECAAYSQDYNYIDCVSNACVCVDTFTKVDGLCSCEQEGVYWTTSGTARCLSAGECVLDYYGPSCNGTCTNYNALGVGECSS